MSEIKVNKITPRVACGTTQLGDSGDTFTIPSGATITNAGTASGFGATGETSWDTTVKTTGTFTATAGVGYFLNTTGGIITVNLPVGAAGSSVAMADYAGTWQTNNVTVAANGTEKIGGVDADVTLNTEGQAVTFVYIDGTQGWVNVLDSTSNVRGANFVSATVSGACNTLTTAPDCANTKIATFLGPGAFCVSSVSPCAANNLVSYLVVAGGGSGGTNKGGGGGAGGFREYESPVTPYTSSPLDGNPGGTAITVTASPYTIAVGGGGGGQTSPGSPTKTPGNVSTFSTITSTGGGSGGGGGMDAGNNPQPSTGRSGDDGGSGGGVSDMRTCAAYKGAGNTPPVNPSQGFGGGLGMDFPPSGGGGGGGATAIGTDYPLISPGTGGTTAGVGGAGATTSISASPVAYAGGGGGGATSNNAGPGGTGGGGAGAVGGCQTATSGTANRGGGGGGGATTNPAVSGGGGSGIVIIRYKFQ